MTAQVGGMGGATRCEPCERSVGDPSRAMVLKPFNECVLTEAEAKKIEKRTAKMMETKEIVPKSGRASMKSKGKCETPELELEVSDSALWALVVKSQRRPSEEPSFDRVDIFDGYGGKSVDDDSFINGLIRFPSYGELERDFGDGEGYAARAQSHPGSSSSGEMARFERGLLGESTAADEQHERLRRRRENSVSSQCTEDHIASKLRGIKRLSSHSMSSSNGLEKMFNPSRVTTKQDDLLAAPMQERSDASYGDFGSSKSSAPPAMTLAEKVSTVSSSSLPSMFPVSHAAFAVQSMKNTSKLPGGCDREKVLKRYHDKRKVRSFSKTIHYEARKVRAETRVRVGGRFAPSSDRRKARSVDFAA